MLSITIFKFKKKPLTQINFTANSRGQIPIKTAPSFDGAVALSADITNAKCLLIRLVNMHFLGQNPYFLSTIFPGDCSFTCKHQEHVLLLLKQLLVCHPGQSLLLLRHLLIHLDFLNPTDLSVFQHDFDPMRVMAAVRQDTGNDTFSQLSGRLILFQYDLNFCPDMYVSSVLPIHFSVSFLCIRNQLTNYSTPSALNTASSALWYGIS